MAVYTYLCPVDGVFDVRAPIGTAEPEQDCPACSGPSPRRILAPRLSLGDPAARTLLDRTARSAAEPFVTSALPTSSRRPPVSTNPLHRRLPRP
ncbi:zinc ribbon domain-containing protein [Kineococcus gynurae]|uniref:Zinc ribbon domain-containing protein n=1 Tax=Kineococcus gynurae TaxID=452979 RepID=A0ABV5LW38_9ACTN